jgi:hypothetical protein
MQRKPGMYCVVLLAGDIVLVIYALKMGELKKVFYFTTFYGILTP